jgi:hypothetical protein
VVERIVERVVGIEHIHRVLLAGTVLTVVGRATMGETGAGGVGLRFSAGVGPFPGIVSTDTLPMIAESYFASSDSSKRACVAFGIIAVAAGGYGLYKRFIRGKRKTTQS